MKEIIIEDLKEGKNYPCEDQFQQDHNHIVMDFSKIKEKSKNGLYYGALEAKNYEKNLKLTFDLKD